MPRTGRSTSPSPTPNSTSTSWPSYTDPTLRISFKYPPEWTVEKRTIHHPFNAQDTTDYHVISLKADQEIVTFTYPFELSGCGQSGQKVYTFGSHAVTMVDTCASTPKLAGTYYGWFKNPQPVPANVNAQDWPELVVAYRYSPQTEPDFIEFAKSVTGLTPR